MGCLLLPLLTRVLSDDNCMQPFWLLSLAKSPAEMRTTAEFRGHLVLLVTDASEGASVQICAALTQAHRGGHADYE